MRAVRAAFWLVFGLVNREEMARAGGWLTRAQRLLDDISWTAWSGDTY